MNRDIWQHFHYGYINRIDRIAPGLLRLEIAIEYLRDMFPEPGTRFVVTLTACSKFVYCGYDEQPTDDIAEIQAREPEILYINSMDPLVLDCADGTLELAYEAMTVALESGRPVTEDALVQASDKYWKDFASRAERDP
jgi:hypothetical protein